MPAPIGISENRFLVASITNVFKDKISISVAEQDMTPYSIFECKRVGVEEGTKKGPQTIEKSKARSLCCQNCLFPTKNKTGRRTTLWNNI